MKTFLIIVKMVCLVGGGAAAALKLALQDHVEAGTWPARIEWLGDIGPAVGAVIATNLYAFLSSSWQTYQNGANKPPVLPPAPSPTVPPPPPPPQTP